MKEVKYTNKQIVDILRSVQNADIASKKFPMKFVFAFRKNIKMLTSVYEAYSECLSSMADRYTKEQLQSDDPEFVLELNELLAQENDLRIEDLSQDILLNMDESKYDALSYSDLDSLSWMISEEI